MTEALRKAPELPMRQWHQNPSIKEYTLNYSRIPNMIEGILLH